MSATYNAVSDNLHTCGRSLYLSTLGLNSFADLALTVLPAVMLWRVKIRLAKKLAVIFLLSLSVVYVLVLVSSVTLHDNS
jgi:hypothetical protein